MAVDGYSWDLDPNEPLMIQIKKDGAVLFTLFMGEAIEQSKRSDIMKHIEECDRTPWLRKWHERDISE